MIEFLDSLGRKRQIGFSPSFKEGYVVMCMYNDKSTYGDCIEMPLSAAKELIKNLEEVCVK
jgi:hypothetical protein